MSLDFSLNECVYTNVFDINITHNLVEMADAAGIYKYLWRPEEVSVKKARELIPRLTNALKDLKEHPSKYKEYDAENGWGTYDHFVPFVESVLKACIKHPNADISVSR